MECVFAVGRPLLASRRNWQILSREQSENRARRSCPVRCLFTRTWLAFPCRLVISVQVGGCMRAHLHACVHVTVHVCVCVCFSKKPEGHGTDCTGGDPHRPSAASRRQQRNSGAPFFASIFLVGDRAGEAQRPALFFPQSKLPPPVQRGERKPPG